MNSNDKHANNQLLTVREIADQFKIAVRTVYRWVELGRLPKPIRIGTRTIRWRKSEIDCYIEQR